MTKREEFAKEQMDKEKKAVEEENHEDEVSFGAKFMYLRMAIFSGICLFASYQGHLKVTKIIQDRDDRLNGKTKEYDPSDPEMLEKLSEREREFVMPGGSWEIKDLKGKSFGSDNLSGSYYLLFFGHTLCPEVTPLTVNKMTKAIRKVNSHKES